MSSYDAIVVGLGSMGSAAARTLAARGLRVLGLENFGPAHEQGSIHGGSRIVRQSYYEGAAYVPLLRRSFEAFDELAAKSGRDLIHRCGGIYVGRPDSPIVAGAEASAREHGLPYELLDAAEIHRRFPAFATRDDAVGLLEPNAGWVQPEETVLANLDLAHRDGADLHFDEPVLSWRTTGAGGVEVTTATATYGGDRLVLAPGAWAGDLLAGLSERPIPIAVERQVFYWIHPAFTAELPYERYADLPVFIEDAGGTGEIYGFPASDGPDGGLKVAFYRQNHGKTTTPQTVDRVVTPAEMQDVQQRARQLIPGLTGRVLQARTCLYAAVPDDHFVIGCLPESPQVVLACGFSGHGFKFVPVVGEIVADLVQTGRTAYDISLFDPMRPAFLGS